jgi:AraC family transcriptional regulator, activator of mtrCDE
MVGDPAKLWKLDELASLAVVSRATLERAFRRIGGMPPQISNRVAARIIHTSDALGDIAVGYQSEAVLSRAINHRFAIRPGAMRRTWQEAFAGTRRLRQRVRHTP